MASSDANPMRAVLATLEHRHRWSMLTVDGSEWRWLDTQAEGPVFVMLPGSVGDGAMFVRTLNALGARLRLISVTYPAVSDPRDLAQGLAGVVDHLGLGSFALVGSSFGAYWAQYFALAHGRRLTHLILGNGLVDSTDLQANPLFASDWIESVTSQELHRGWLDRVQAASASELRDLQLLMLAERQSAVNLHARFLGVARARACPPLPMDDSRITVLDCDDDPLIPPATRKRLADCYPRARHLSLPHGGHYPHVLNPGAYEQLLVDIAF